MASYSPGRPVVAAGALLAHRYRLDSLIATGGMAQVWLATDERLERPVAVKVLHPHLAADDAFVERFRREARAAARLSHHAIVSVYDTFSVDGVDAIVMEMIEGQTLRQHLAAQGRLRPAAAVEIAREVADALDSAHHAGIIHRDIKPANILLTDDDRVRVADFGIAKANVGLAADATLTETGAIMGTAKYVAPEQLDGGTIDRRTDVYAIGAVLYEMLVGEPPFVGDTEAATALARLHRDPVPPSARREELPAWLDSVTLTAMARSPEDRFADAGELRDALRRGQVVDRRAAVATPEDPTGVLAVDRATAATAARPARRRILRPTTVVGVLVLAAMIVATLLFTGDQPGDGEEGTAPLAAAPIASTRTFDPEGTGTPGENDSLVGAATDGDPATAWRTEGYRAQDLRIKSGVGIVVELERPDTIRALEVTSPSRGWDADVRVADELEPALEDWSEPVARTTGTGAGTTTLTFQDPPRGRYVLLWFTRLAPDTDGKFRVHVSELRVLG